MRKSALARSAARSVREPMICGSSKSSVIACPSAIRSGQNVTSTSSPRAASSRSTAAVTPGNTVLRRTISWPSRKWSPQASRARVTAPGSGLRCSSTGVPITITTASLPAITAGSVVATSDPSAIRFSSTGAAPFSWNGISARETRSTAASEMS